MLLRRLLGPLLLLLALPVHSPAARQAARRPRVPKGGGWDRAVQRRLESRRCSIDRVNASALSTEQLRSRFSGERLREPAMISGAFPFAPAEWGANWSTSSFLGRTLIVPELAPLQALPEAQAKIPPPPSWLAQAVPPAENILVRGAGGTGTLFHNHGAALNVLAFGAKRWLLHAPGWEGRKSWRRITGGARRITVVDFVEKVLPRLPEAELPLDCMQEQGDIMYVPSGWQHATLNTMETVTYRSSPCWLACADDGSACR